MRVEETKHESSTAREANVASLSTRTLFEALLARLLEAVLSVYAERLITLAVFGSVARGTATAESDVDLLLIAAPPPRGRTRRLAEFAQVEDRLAPDLRQMAQAGIHTCLSPILKTPDEVRAGSPLFLDMVFDVRLLYDRDHFFARFLQDFAERLRRLGAKRIVQGDRWYWDLKPDYRPGEIFEL